MILALAAYSYAVFNQARKAVAHCEMRIVRGMGMVHNENFAIIMEVVMDNSFSVSFCFGPCLGAVSREIVQVCMRVFMCRCFFARSLLLALVRLFSNDILFPMICPVYS